MDFSSYISKQHLLHFTYVLSITRTYYTRKNIVYKHILPLVYINNNKNLFKKKCNANRHLIIIARQSQLDIVPLLKNK